MSGSTASAAQHAQRHIHIHGRPSPHRASSFLFRSVCSPGAEFRARTGSGSDKASDMPGLLAGTRLDAPDDVLRRDGATVVGDIESPSASVHGLHTTAATNTSTQRYAVTSLAVSDESQALDAKRAVVQQRKAALERANETVQQPAWKQCSFWVYHSLLLAWAGLFACLGSYYYLQERDPDCDQPTDALPSSAAEVSTCGSSSILWRVFFFLACIPAAIWCSHIIGYAFLYVFRGIEKWAHDAQERQCQRERQALAQRSQQQLPTRQAEKPVAQGCAGLVLQPAPQGTAPPSSNLSERIRRKSQKHDSPLQDQAELVAPAGTFHGPGDCDNTPADEVGEDSGPRGAMNGIRQVILSLEPSYLAQRTQPQLRQCLFMGINAGMWYLFWALNGPSASGPPFDNRFWIFFRVLVCLTLFLLANLLTRIISSFVGIKLKRLNHLDRMQDIAKREALLILLVSQGVEDRVRALATSQEDSWRWLLPPSYKLHKPMPCTPAAPSQGKSVTGTLQALREASMNMLRRPMTLLQSCSTQKRCNSLPAKMDEERGDASPDGLMTLRRSASECAKTQRSGPEAISQPPPPAQMHSPGSIASLGKECSTDAGMPSAYAEDHVMCSKTQSESLAHRSFWQRVQSWMGGTRGKEQAALASAGEAKPGMLSLEANNVINPRLMAGEWHFLQPELKVPYWYAGGGEEGVSRTIALTESELTDHRLGNYIYKRVLGFLRKRDRAIRLAQNQDQTCKPSGLEAVATPQQATVAETGTCSTSVEGVGVYVTPRNTDAPPFCNRWAEPEYFKLSDLQGFLEARSAEDSNFADDVDYAFQVLDVDCSGRVTREDTRGMVCQLYKDRVNLRKTLMGTNAILMKLDIFVGTLLHLMFIIFYLLVCGFTFTSGFFEGFSALLLAFSFIFSSAISNLYENVSFVFLVHPFDVGDMLLLNGIRHEVKKVFLSCTHFLDKEGGCAIWSNKVLRDTPFINLTRSENMEDGFELLLDLDAAQDPDLLANLKGRLDRYMQGERKSEFDFNSGTKVTFRDITNPNGILLKVEWRYSHKGIDKERCANARTGMLIHAAQALKDLKVRYSRLADHPGAFINGTGNTPGGKSDNVGASRQGDTSGYSTPGAPHHAAPTTAKGMPHSGSH